MAAYGRKESEGWESWYDSVCLTYGLTDDTVQVLKQVGGDTPKAFMMLTDDDVGKLPIPAPQRHYVIKMLEDLKTTYRLTVRNIRKKLAQEFRQAFPTSRYTVEAYCLEEEEESEVEAMMVCTKCNPQDEVLVYCKPYVVSCKTGTLDGDQLFSFVAEAIEMMNDGSYKGALLLLPENTFLPRSLAEMLQRAGDMFTLRHGDTFVSDARQEVNKLLKSGLKEVEEEEHGKIEPTTLRGQAYLVEVSPGEMVLITEDGDMRSSVGCENVNPQRPTPKSGKPDTRHKVNRRLYPELPKPPRQYGPQDTASKSRESHPKSSTNRHLKEDETPDGRAKEKRASKESSSTTTTTTTTRVSTAVHVKKDGSPDMRYKENKMAAGLSGLKKDGTPDMRFKENKTAAGLYGIKKDYTPDMRFKKNEPNYDSTRSTSVHGYTTPLATASDLLGKDGTQDTRHRAKKTPSPVPSVHSGTDEEFHTSGLYSPGRGFASTHPSVGSSWDDDLLTGGFYSSGSSYAVGPLKKDGTPDMRYKVNKMAAGLYGLKLDGTPDMRFKENKMSYDSSGYLPGSGSGYVGSPSWGYAGYSAGPLKKDGTPDMRYKANKIAAGLYGLKMDGTPDRRFKANRR